MSVCLPFIRQTVDGHTHLYPEARAHDRDTPPVCPRINGETRWPTDSITWYLRSCCLTQAIDSSGMRRKSLVWPKVRTLLHIYSVLAWICTVGLTRGGEQRKLRSWHKRKPPSQPANLPVVRSERGHHAAVEASAKCRGRVQNRATIRNLTLPPALSSSMDARHLFACTIRLWARRATSPPSRTADAPNALLRISFCTSPRSARQRRSVERHPRRAQHVGF